MIDYSDIFRSQAESLNTAGMEGILRAADVPREVAQNFSVKEIVLNMLSGDAAVNQEKVLDLLKTMFFGEIRGLVSLAAQLICICIAAGILSSFASGFGSMTSPISLPSTCIRISIRSFDTP